MSTIPDLPPAEFPLPHQSPNAVPAEGTVYRLTTGKLKLNATASDNDWILPISKSSGECTLPEANKRRECYGHSVFTELQELLNAQKSIPWARKKSISSVSLTCGWVESTPSSMGASHHDWWPEPLNHIPTATCVSEKP
nr:hypothetical protein pA58H3_p45 [Arthrobacter sp.]